MMTASAVVVKDANTENVCHYVPAGTKNVVQIQGAIVVVPTKLVVKVIVVALMNVVMMAYAFLNVQILDSVLTNRRNPTM